MYEDNERLLIQYSDHCLDRIRASLMCQPDVSSLTTFVWDNNPKPRVERRKTLHACVNWDELMASTLPRVVSRQEIAGLVNPRLQE